MNSPIGYAFLLFLFLNLNACSRVLETVDISIDTNDPSAQQKFDVVEKTLTLAEALKQKDYPYQRMVLQVGKGNNAKTIEENKAVKSIFPNSSNPQKYRVGAGDKLTFTKLVDNKFSDTNFVTEWPAEQEKSTYKLGIGDELTLLQIVETNQTRTQVFNPIQENLGNNINLPPESPTQNLVESKGRIGSDGSILLLEVGRLEAKGKSINQLRSEIRNILIRNGASPRFQLEIVSFRSQRAYLTINEKSKVIDLSDKLTNLRDVLAEAEKGLLPGIITTVRLQREGKTYIMKLRDLLGQEAPKIVIRNKDHIFIEDRTSEIETTEANVSEDGNVVIPDVGRVNILGLSLSEIDDLLKNKMQKLPYSKNTFQIVIKEFNSKKAVINLPGQTGGVIPITNKIIWLDEVLTAKGLAVDGKKITKINLQREGKSYQFTLNDLFEINRPRIFLEPNDRVIVDNLQYKENKVFILGGVSPQIFKINPANRETLADVLFTSGGPLSASGAKRSEVYLLRGSNPVVAYHLDAQSPTRLIVADAMELRPNDIIYVAEQPIISFNRTLATIIPLRLLLRDVQDENIP